MTAFRTFAILVALSLLAPITRAQALADRLPADTILYFSWSGAQNLGAAYDESHWKGFNDASHPSRLIREFLPKLVARISKNQVDAVNASNAIASLADPMWDHPSAIVFTGVNFRTIVGPMPRFAIVCQAGADGAKIKQAFDALQPRFQTLPVPIRFEQIDDFSILSIGYNQGESVLVDKAGSTLATAPNFTAALAKVTPNPAAVAYIDVENLLAVVEQVMATKAGPREQEKWATSKKALGLDALKRMILTGNFDGKDFAWRGFIDAPEPRTGLVAAFVNKAPIPDDLIKTIPDSATFAGAFGLDLDRLVSSLSSMASWSNPNAQREIDRGLAHASQFLGLDIRRDVLQPFGSAWALYWSPDTGGNGLLTFTLINRANDAAKVDVALTQITNVAANLITQNSGGQASPKLRELQSTGVTVKYFPLPVVSPSWAIKDGNVYLALYPQVLVSSLERDGKSLAERPEFTSLRDRLNAPPGAQFTWIDIPRTAPDGYPAVLLISQLGLGLGDAFGAESPSLLFPPISRLTPHLAPAAIASWSAADGLHYAAIIPFPGAEFLGSQQSFILGETALATSVLLPSLNRSRETANRVKCASNLRQIGQGILLYANDNKGQYPPDLATLYKSEDIQISAFICPSGDTTIPPDIRNAPRDKQASWITDHTDYIYLGKAMNNTAAPDTVVCYEKDQDHKDGMNLLFGDGHVEYLRLPEAKKMIEKSGAAQGGVGL
jgi:prepilin-type processing-associated H-X9-DG protein